MQRTRFTHAQPRRGIRRVANIAMAMYHLDDLLRVVSFPTDDACSAIVEALQHAKTDGTRANFVKMLSFSTRFKSKVVLLF